MEPQRLAQLGQPVASVLESVHPKFGALLVLMSQLRDSSTPRLWVKLEQLPPSLPLHAPARWCTARMVGAVTRLCLERFADEFPVKLLSDLAYASREGQQLYQSRAMDGRRTSDVQLCIGDYWCITADDLVQWTMDNAFITDHLVCCN